MLTTSHNQVFDHETGQATDVTILRVPSYDVRWLIWFLRRKKSTYFSPQLKQQPGVSWIRRAVDSFPLNIILGDGGFFTCSLVIGALRLWGEISHLYSSFRPMSDHFLAYLLVQRFPFLIWIADFRDVPVDPLLQNVWWPGFQHWILRKLLGRAQYLTTVSEGLAQHLRTHYGRPVQVILNAPMRQQSMEVHAQNDAPSWENEIKKAFWSWVFVEKALFVEPNPLFSDLSAFFYPQPMQDFNKAVFSFVLGENT